MALRDGDPPLRLAVGRVGVHADQRRARQVHRRAALARGVLLQARQPALRARRAVARDADGDRRLGVHQLQRDGVAVQVEARAQHLVPVDHPLRGLLERGRVQRAGAADQERRRVLIRVHVRPGPHLHDHAELGGRQRVGVHHALRQRLRGPARTAARTARCRARARRAPRPGCPPHASTSSAIVWWAKMSAAEISRPSARSRAASATARSESPPTSKKFACGSTSSRPSTSHQARCTASVSASWPAAPCAPVAAGSAAAGCGTDAAGP